MLTFQCHLLFFWVFFSDKTIKLWKISERDKRAEGYNLKDEDGRLREPFRLTSLRVCTAVCLVLKTFSCLPPDPWHARYASQVPVLMPMDLMVEASPRRIFANAHTYHINSISVNSDHETYLSADDLRINLWHLEITDRSFSILFSVIGPLTVVWAQRPKKKKQSAAFLNVLFSRYCRHQARQHGGIDGSNHSCWVPSTSMQCICVQQ